MTSIESGVQLFSRLNQKTFLEGINPHIFPEGPYPNQIVEITGHPNVCKDDLLIDLLVKCILPTEYCSEWKGSGAVFINTEFQINLFKIIKVIETHLNYKNVKEGRKGIIEDSLKNLTIYNCYGPEELEITILSLQKFIYSNENVNLVLIDNITAHYWIARQSSKMLSYYQHSMKMLEKLYNVIKDLNTLLVYVRNDKESSRKNASMKIDYRIEVIEYEDKFKAVVTNFGNESTGTIEFKVDIIVLFCV
ncbi:unnamed protein product [Phaedon cochleariae]|uniref:Uncharacterized protein n=1 Tax=Phaedon cochleariae TaxID=80249 RepID=A0A9P0DR42_PHACE|nr:unnamed protein product [Phaedon cochleariae]